MKFLIALIASTLLLVFALVIKSGSVFSQYLEVDKILLEKSTPIDGRIDTKFLEKTFGPAYEQ